MKNLFNLQGKMALITGGGGLLGPKHAEAIIECGGRVVLADWHEDKAQAKAKHLNEKYGQGYITQAWAEHMDVTSRQSIEKVVEKYNVDILINNAAKDPKVKKELWDLEQEGGLTPDSRFETMTEDYWKEGLDAAVNGTFLCSQVVANQMLKRTGGVILNIASDLGVIAPDQRIYKKEGIEENAQNVKPITYSAAKWAIIGMTKYLAVYFAKRGIRVNSLSPTAVYNNHPEEFVSKLTNLIPMGRMSNIDEYKGAIAFLCSQASSYMTGENLIIDGGKSVW